MQSRNWKNLCLSDNVNYKFSTFGGVPVSNINLDSEIGLFYGLQCWSVYRALTNWCGEPLNLVVLVFEHCRMHSLSQWNFKILHFNGTAGFTGLVDTLPTLPCRIAIWRHAHWLRYIGIKICCCHNGREMAKNCLAETWQLYICRLLEQSWK